jgi:hypothetical protein
MIYIFKTLPFHISCEKGIESPVPASAWARPL